MISEGHIGRMVLSEGHIGRMVLSEGHICRVVLSEGHIGRVVLSEGHIGRNKGKRQFDENGDCTKITQLPADARRNCVGYV